MEVNPFESPQTLNAACQLDMQDVLHRLRVPLLGLKISAIVHLIALIAMPIVLYLLVAHDAKRYALESLLLAGLFIASVITIPCMFHFVALRIALREEQLWTCRIIMLLACVPLLSPGIVLGIPFGIWGAVILFLPGTAAAFRRSTNHAATSNS